MSNSARISAAIFRLPASAQDRGQLAAQYDLAAGVVGELAGLIVVLGRLRVVDVPAGGRAAKQFAIGPGFKTACELDSLDIAIRMLCGGTAVLRGLVNGGPNLPGKSLVGPPGRIEIAAVSGREGRAFAVPVDVDRRQRISLFLVGQANAACLLELLARLFDFPLVQQAGGVTVFAVGKQRMVLQRLVIGEQFPGLHEPMVLEIARPGGRRGGKPAKLDKRAGTEEHGQVLLTQRLVDPPFGFFRVCQQRLTEKGRIHETERAA